MKWKIVSNFGAFLEKLNFTDSMENPKSYNQIYSQNLKIFRLFLLICGQFQVFQNSYPGLFTEAGLNYKNIFLSSFWNKKNFGSDTEIRPWFRFPIPKPSFGRILIETILITNGGSPVFILTIFR